jgi:hypothetical protein
MLKKLPRPNPAAGAPFAPGGRSPKLRWIENPEACGLRYVGDHTEGERHGRRDATAFYLDSFCDETAWGVVYRLPGQRGFVAGVATSHHSERGDPGLAALAICEAPEQDKDEALAYSAHLADWYAESERDRAEAWSEGVKHGDAITEAHGRREAALRQMLAARVLMRAAVAELLEAREDCREARKARDRARRDCRGHLRPAFDEGCGLA